MYKAKKAAKSVFVLIILSLCSKLFGFIREALIAQKFGSGVITDTYFIAISAISIFSKIAIQSLYTTMIPVLSEVESKEGGTGKRDYVSNLLNITFVMSLAVVIIGWFAAPVTIELLAYGFIGRQFDLAVLAMRMGLPAIIFSGMVGVFRGYIQSEFRFIESSVADFAYSIVFITFLLFLSGIFDIKGLIVTSVLAVGSQVLMQIPSLKKLGYRYKFKLNFKDIYVKKVFSLMPPVLFSVAVTDINKMVDKSLASSLIDGSISALNYGNRVKDMVLDVFIMAVATVIFPILSKEANAKSYDGFKKVVRLGTNITTLVTIPATVGMVILAKPIVAIAFQRGAFTAADTYMTANALIYYAIGLLGISQRRLLYRVYYSLKDTKTPMINGFITVVLNIILNFILVRYMAHSGLALATSIAETVTIGFLLYGLARKIGRIGALNLIKCGVKSLFSSSVMGLVVFLLYDILSNVFAGSLIGELGILLLICLVGAFVYLAVIYLLKVDEVYLGKQLAKAKLKQFFKRNTNPAAN